MKCIFPSKSYDKYKSYFETQWPVNELLSKRQSKKDKIDHEIIKDEKGLIKKKK